MTNNDSKKKKDIAEEPKTEKDEVASKEPKAEKDDEAREVADTKKKEAKKEEAKKDTKAKSTDQRDKDSSKEKEGAKKNEDRETYETKYLRMTADFQNYKRRVEKEKSEIYKNANERFACDLLEVVDNFERAIEQDESRKADEQFLKGMGMILTQLQDVLKKNNVEEIDALGVEFDPKCHHAVAMETSDKYKKDCVTSVMQKGYKLKDKVIRPAMVKVAE